MTFSLDIVGESCFILKSDASVLITDPWFGENIYGGAWTQFPRPQIYIDQLRIVTHIFISHVHADHCCLSSLDKIFKYSPNAQIVIMDRGKKPCFITKKLVSHYGDLILNSLVYIEPYKEFRVNDISLWTLPPESDHNSLNEIIDSSLLIKSDLGLILFSNDNLPSQKHANFINELNIPQYLGLLPFSGGSGYPCSYQNISKEDQLSIASKIREDYHKISINFLKSTAFKYFMPVAGNHIIVSRDSDWHKTTGFLQNPISTLEYAHHLGVDSYGLFAYPSSNVNLDQCIIHPDLFIEERNRFEFDRQLFIETISSRMLPSCLMHDNTVKEVDIRYSFQRYSIPIQKTICSLSKATESPEIKVILIIGLLKLEVTTQNSSVSRFSNEDLLNIFCKSVQHINSILLVIIEPSLYYDICSKNIHINEADAAGLLTYVRTMPYYPDLYATIFSVIN